MTVQKISAWVPASDALLLDAGYDGPMATLMRERLAELAADEDRKWRSLPWYTRLHRTLYYWSWRIPQRFHDWLHRDCA